MHTFRPTSTTLKKGALGLTLGVGLGELAVPLVYKLAKHLPRRWRKAIYRYSPSHNKGLGMTMITTGLFTRSPMMISAGLGLVATDVHNFMGKDKRMAKEWNLAIKGMPPISIERYDIPDWLPRPMQYRIIMEKFQNIVCDETYNKARRVWIPAGRDHPAVLVTARRIIKEYGLDGHNKAAVLQAIGDWIQKNIAYCYDARYLDQFVHPYLTLIFGAGDCDCQTLLACSLGEALGIPMQAKLISQMKDDPTRMNHVFACGRVDRGNGLEWVPIETIFKGVPMGWSAPSVNSMTVEFD